MDIKQTTDYKQFKTIKGNRKLSHANYINLTNSIAKHNLLAYSPIVVNKKMEVIDGQHRLKVAEDNSLPIYYVMVDEADINEIRLLNANALKWSTMHFLESYAAEGHEDYNLLLDFMKAYDLPLGVAAVLVGGEGTVGARDATSTTGATHGNVFAHIRNGTYKAKYLKEAQELGDIITQFRKFVPRNVYGHVTFLRAIRRIAGDNPEITRALPSKMERYGLSVERSTDVKGYLRQFEDIYNFRLSEANRIRLY